MGFNIDLLCTDTININDKDFLFVKKYINNLYFAKRKNRVIDLLSKEPLQVLSRIALKSIPINKKYEYLILEGDYVGEVINNHTIQYKNLIVRSQNDESLYFNNLSKSTNNIYKKIYYKQESRKFKIYSRKIYDKADRIWFISNDEKLAYNSINSIWLPSPFSLSEIKIQKLKSQNVLFIGSLFMPNNIEALFWFLNNVHDKLTKVFLNYKLIIAGSTNGINKVALLKKFNKYSNIEFNFDVQDLTNLYENASIFINPMFHGAGVKIKSINAIINGLPLVSTSIGVQGTGLIDAKDFLLANTANEFLEKISNLLNNNISKTDLVINGQKYLQENHYLKLLKEELKCD